MVDPPENGVGQAKTLLERLQKELHRRSLVFPAHHPAICVTCSRTGKDLLAAGDLDSARRRHGIECTEEKFDELLEEVKPVANRIVDSLKQDAEA